ncbi:MAG: type I restriction endonuclease subunit M [Acidobacteriota bacterium]|nr:type I restriction endonuclease subunit M [Acidobacteriota bacterium]
MSKDQTNARDPLFSLGQIVATRGVLASCTRSLMTESLFRHQRGDWGVVDPEDRQVNDDAVTSGGRILSAYAIDPARPSKGFGDNTLWIITEHDRSITTLLLPDEY